jgi:hypothetical protein
MPRILIVADGGRELEDAPVLFDEAVNRMLLEDHHASHQILERMTWALGDAETLEREPAHAAA